MDVPWEAISLDLQIKGRKSSVLRTKLGEIWKTCRCARCLHYGILLWQLEYILHSLVQSFGFVSETGPQAVPWGSLKLLAVFLLQSSRHWDCFWFIVANASLGPVSSSSGARAVLTVFLTCSTLESPPSPWRPKGKLCRWLPPAKVQLPLSHLPSMLFTFALLCAFCKQFRIQLRSLVFSHIPLGGSSCLSVTVLPASENCSQT